MSASKITQGYHILDNVNLTHPESMNDEFGYAVAADGTTVIVGAYNQDINTKKNSAQISHSDILRNGGGAYLFQKGVDGSWESILQLQSPNPQPAGYFGRSVTIDGKALAVGMPNYDSKKGKNVGAIYIFEQKNNVWQAEPVAEFVGEIAEARFGYRVAISGDTLAIGAPSHDEGEVDKVGAVYVCEKRNGRWRKPIRLKQPTGLIARNQLGRSLDIDEDVIVVGAPGRYRATIGQAFVYTRDEFGQWGDPYTIKQPDFIVNQTFGRDVAVNGNRLLIGATDDEDGAALLYERAQSGWKDPIRLPSPENKGNSFSRRLALGKKTAVVGASNDHAKVGKEAGRVYLYEFKNGEWQSPIVLESPDLAHNEAKGFFGGSLAITETAVVVGAPWQDPDGKQTAGRVFICEKNDRGSWPIDDAKISSENRPYFFDTANAWVNRLQNVLDCIETTQTIAEDMVDELRQNAQSVQDWYELTQINALNVLLKNLYAFGDVQIKLSFRALTIKNNRQSKRVVHTDKLRQILNHLSTDLEIIQRALDQRRRIDGRSTSQGHALLTADVVTAQAMKPARGSLLQNRYVRIITYLSEVMGIRILPYDPDVILIGIPFASVAGINLNSDQGNIHQINWDFLALPHEVAHYLYRYFSDDQPSLEHQIHEKLEERFGHDEVPPWIENWLEEIFADVYGCLLAGPISVFGLQDILSDATESEILADNAHHPIPALRPFIGSNILRRISADDTWFDQGAHSAYSKLVYLQTPERLDENWRLYLDHRFGEEIGESIDETVFKISNSPSEHDHHHHGLSQDAVLDTHGDDPFIELKLDEVLEAIKPVVDVILELLSENLFLIGGEFPWSEDADTLDGLNNTLRKGIPMPVEPFGKIPDPSLYEWSGGIRRAEKTLENTLNLWANKGPEGEINPD
ncbi:MAG: FG-GAP repeat protein [Chloroflexota bacterium]